MIYLNEIQYKNQMDLDYKVEKIFCNFFTARHYGKDCLEKNDNFHLNVLYDKMFDIHQDLMDFASIYLC